MPEQPPVLNTPFRFPKFNPGVTLTSAPYVPTAQVVGDPRNVVKQLDSSAFLPPPPPPAAAAKPRMDPKLMQQLGMLAPDNRFGGGRSGGYTTSTGQREGGWGRTSSGTRSSAYGGYGGGGLY